MPKKKPSAAGARPSRVSEPHTVNLYEAKTRLSELVDRAAAGEEIVIAKNGRPLARLGPVPVEKPNRTPGGWEGMVWIAEDFDDPLPDDIQRYFEGEDDDGGST